MVEAVNPSNQPKAIAEIYNQNPKLLGKVRIVQVGWSKKVITQRKKRAALHIRVADPA